MKTSVMLILVGVAVALTLSNAAVIEKRFWLKDLDLPIDVGDILDKVFQGAKKVFDAFNGSTSYEDAVENLIPLISSAESQGVCVGICQASAFIVLGGDQAMAGKMCPPVCEGALEQLKNAAGK